MQASGTKIKKEKSCTLFFNTTGNVKSYLSRIMGFSTGNLLMKYLGMSLVESPLKMAGWQQTIQTIQESLVNWAFRSLNIAGRTILVKAVLQSIPIYQLFGMEAPKGACTKMVDIFKIFLWGRAQ